MNVRSRGARDFEEEKENNSDSDLPTTYNHYNLTMLDLRVFSCFTFGVF